MKHTISRKSSVLTSPIEDQNGLLIYDAERKANIFNTFFSSIAQGDNNLEIPENNIPQYPDIPNLTIYPNMVNKLLKELNVNKATGPDKIGNRILKE